MSCIQQLIGNHGLGFNPDRRNHCHNEQLVPPGLLPFINKITKTFSPHTKLSGGTEKMLWPLSDSGWAQVAVTKACSILPSNHGGSHFSWQSHRKLSLLIRLKEKHKGRLRCDWTKKEYSLRIQNDRASPSSFCHSLLQAVMGSDFSYSSSPMTQSSTNHLPGHFGKMQLFGSVGQGWNPRFCIANKLPGHADTTGVDTCSKTDTAPM